MQLLVRLFSSIYCASLLICALNAPPTIKGGERRRKRKEERGKQLCRAYFGKVCSTIFKVPQYKKVNTNKVCHIRYIFDTAKQIVQFPPLLYLSNRWEVEEGRGIQFQIQKKPNFPLFVPPSLSSFQIR